MSILIEARRGQTKQFVAVQAGYQYCS